MKNISISLTTVFILTFISTVYAYTPGLVGYWSFNEGNGTIAHDSSPFGNNGTIHGAVWTEGKCGKALYFDGYRDYVEIMPNSMFNMKNFTIEAWIYLKTLISPHHAVILTKRLNINQLECDYQLAQYSGTNKIQFYHKVNNIGEAVYSDRGFDINKWHHITETVSDKYVNFYLDGEIIGRKKLNIPISLRNYSLFLGGVIDPDWVNGLIDEVKIYNRPLSQKEIQKDMLCETVRPPLPTNRSLIITNSSWRNVLSVSSLSLPVIVSDSLTENLQEFINEYGPDYIYTLGVFLGLNNSFQISRKDIPSLFFPNTTRALYANSTEKAIYSSAIAYILRLPLLTEPNSKLNMTDLSANTTSEIQEAYLNELRKNNETVNYLVLANLNHSSSLLAGRIAAMHHGYVVGINISQPRYPEVGLDNCDAECWNIKNSVPSIMFHINKTVNFLANQGLFYAKKHYLNGSYILLTGNVPSIIRNDPVEMQWLAWNDPEDSDWFTTDLDYGDMNGDGIIDIAPGRFPKSLEDSSLLLARLSLKRGNKTALVMAEYMHKFWPVILLYIGGGMWQGKSMEDVLSREGYNVTRLVEYRSNITSLVSDLMPSHLKHLINDADKIGKKAGAMLGKTAGTVASRVFVVIKVLQFVEQGLEVYLEYDWSSFTLNMNSALKTINHFIESPPHNWEDIASGIILSLFPDRNPELNATNIMIYLPESGAVYYEGIANGTHWILPNEYNQWDIFGSPYNGSSALYYKNLPRLSSRLFWDNGNMGLKNFGPETIRKGSLSYIGSSAVVYSPYSAELDIRFFSTAFTTGQSLIHAVNEFAEDSFTWDPGNWILRGDTVKRKSLREFSLLGDPAMEKDPIMPDDYVPETSTHCSASGTCKKDITFSPYYRAISTGKSRTIRVKTSRHILRTGRPILPLLKFDTYLPAGARIINQSFHSTGSIQNLTFPALVPLSHGGIIINTTSNFTGFPERPYAIHTINMPDNRTRLVVLFSPIKTINKNTSYLYENATISVIYNTPATLSVHANDAVQGQPETITVTMSSFSETMNATLVIEVTNGTKSITLNRQVTLSTNNPVIEKFRIENLAEGRYMVRAFMFSDITIGPEKAFFTIHGSPKLLVTNTSLTVNEGEVGEGTVNVTNTGNRVIECIALACEQRNGVYVNFSSKCFDLNPHETIKTSFNVAVEDMHPPETITFSCAAHDEMETRNFTITLDVPPRAVPEIKQLSNNITLRPLENSNSCFFITNTGNIPLSMNISLECPSGIACFPEHTSSTMPGESQEFCINISIPGGFPAGEYEINSTFITSAFNRVFTVLLDVPETVFWSVSPDSIFCNVSQCNRTFIVSNSIDSNAPLNNVTASLTSLSEFSFHCSRLPLIMPGEKGTIALTVHPKEEIKEGTYSGKLIFSAGAVPNSFSIPVTISLTAPRFSITKRYSPKRALMLWNKYLIPKTNHITLLLKREGTISADTIMITDNITGWSIKHLRVFSRSKIPDNKHYVSINATTLLVRIPNAQDINTLKITYDAIWLPHKTQNTSSTVSVKASNSGVYFENTYESMLSTININPPKWLEWFFRKFYT